MGTGLLNAAVVSSNDAQVITATSVVFEAGGQTDSRSRGNDRTVHDTSAIARTIGSTAWIVYVGIKEDS